MSKPKLGETMSIINPQTARPVSLINIKDVGRINLFLLFNLLMVVTCGIFFARQIIWGSIILESVMLIATVGWIGFQHIGYRETLRLKRPSAKEIGVTLIVVAAGIYVASFIDQLFRFYLQYLGTAMETEIPRPQNISQYILSLAAVALLPALAEEILFRGYILASFEKQLNTGKAVFLSALFFGMAHLSISNFWGPFILGLLCGWLVCIFDSIFLGIISHLLNNGLTLTMLYLAPNFWDDRKVLVKDLILGFPPFVIAVFILLMLILKFKPNCNKIKPGKLRTVFKHWSTWLLLMIFVFFAAIELFISSN